MKNTRIKQYLYLIFVVFVFLFCMGLFFHGLTDTDWHDFDVFYNSAQAAMAGKSIYLVTGTYHLPFWYVPWTAWFYIPFAIWPKEFALILYKGTTFLCAIFVIQRLTHFYNPNFKFLDKVLIFSLMIPMNLLLMVVGQMDYILLALIVIIMEAVEQKKDILAGLLFPLLLIKPHLIIVFALFSFWRGGKRMVLISLGLSVFMLVVETIISPNWISEAIGVLKNGGQRIDGIRFITLPSMLGSQENWSGTANLPFTILLIILAILIVWKFRALPTLPLLSLALAASLFCSPRPLAYDLPILIPAMIWLTAKEFKSTLWIWIVAAIIPPLAGFLSNAYLLTLMIFILSVLKAFKTLPQQRKELQGQTSS